MIFWVWVANQNTTSLILTVSIYVTNWQYNCSGDYRDVHALIGWELLTSCDNQLTFCQCFQGSVKKQ